MSVDPPTLIVSINREASSWPILKRQGFFGVNILAAHQLEIAERFTGKGGLKGADRFAGAQWQKKPHTVDAPTARAMLEADPDLLVIDARLAEDAATVPVGLRGARRAPPDKVDAVAASLPRGAKALVYCAWGFEIGGDCAAKLRERGIDAVAVAGGIGTWRADGLPTEPLKEGDSK